MRYSNTLKISCRVFNKNFNWNGIPPQTISALVLLSYWKKNTQKNKNYIMKKNGVEYREMSFQHIFMPKTSPHFFSIVHDTKWSQAFRCDIFKMRLSKLCDNVDFHPRPFEYSSIVSMWIENIDFEERNIRK